jgi:hypothetical protein
MYRLSLLLRLGMHGNRKEMNALTGNKAALLISCSIDMNALTGNAQNHAARSINEKTKESGIWKNAKSTSGNHPAVETAGAVFLCSPLLLRYGCSGYIGRLRSSSTHCGVVETRCIASLRRRGDG